MTSRRIVVVATLGPLALASCEHPDDRTGTAGGIAHAQPPQHVYIGASPPSAPPYASSSAAPSGLLDIAVTAAIVFALAIAFLAYRLSRKKR